MTEREYERLQREIEHSINVKEQLPELAEILKDYPLFDDHDFFVNVDSYGFTLYIDAPDSYSYKAWFIFDDPEGWQFIPRENTCLMWYEAELLCVFQDCCWEMCEIVKKYRDKKAA